MNETVYRYLVLMLLSYTFVLLLVISVNLLSLGAVLGSLVIGTALALAVLVPIE